MAEYTEECCFNYPRDYCRGQGCPCRCHSKEPEDAGPQPDEMVRLQQAFDASEQEVDRLNRLVDTLSRALARYRTMAPLVARGAMDAGDGVMSGDREAPHWLDRMRAEHEARLTVGTRVRVDFGECPHYMVWHGSDEQGVTGDIIGLDVGVPGHPADHRYWVMFDWPIRTRQLWNYAAHELTPIPKRTPEEVVQETLARLAD